MPNYPRWSDDERKKRWEEWQKKRQERMESIQKAREDASFGPYANYDAAMAAKSRVSGYLDRRNPRALPLHGEPSRRSRINTWRGMYGMPPRKRPPKDYRR